MRTDSVLLRLRAANPFPDAPVATRPARRAYRRRLLVVAVALVTLAVLASTAFAISQLVGGDVVQADVTRAEYVRAQHELTLPPGAAWPNLHFDPNSVTTRGGGAGYAVLIAQNRWECYWVDSIRRGDVSQQTRARAEVERILRDNVLVAPEGASENWAPPVVPNHPRATFADDGGYEWKQQTYALAAAGHAQRLVDSCRANR